MTPARAPGAPAHVTGSRGNASAAVSFTTPTDDGGSPITSYVVSAEPGSAATTCSTSPCVLTGLSNGTAYVFTTRAINDVGPGPESAPSSAVTPATVPDAPRAPSAMRGNAQATVSFETPLHTGGSAIRSYTVSASPGHATTSCAVSPYVVSGLTNGTAYAFTVVATNDVGDGAPSGASAAVTPASVPGPPGGVVAVRGDGHATVTFTAPIRGTASPINGFTVTAAPGGIAVTCDASPLHRARVDELHGLHVQCPRHERRRRWA